MGGDFRDQLQHIAPPGLQRPQMPSGAVASGTRTGWAGKRGFGSSQAFPFSGYTLI